MSEGSINNIIENLENLPGHVKEKIFSIINSNSQDYLIEETSLVVQFIYKWPLFIHMAGAIFCLMCSSIYHLFNALSPLAQTILSRFDYGAIALLILGSTVPPIVYGFSCKIHLLVVYLSITFGFCMLAFIVNVLPSGDSPRFRWLRGVLFIIAGLIAGATPFHAAISQYFDLSYFF